MLIVHNLYGQHKISTNPTHSPCSPCHSHTFDASMRCLEKVILEFGFSSVAPSIAAYILNARAVFMILLISCGGMGIRRFSAGATRNPVI